ncbi:CYFA0S26e00716g1_1 [Cyberlindnera fabianii]|uniref:CYFA0S26e00716g1_1 n=2 Tax=Cyberlindnera fabianii TaxID=36022 RepID=A0A061BA83_CYBFA|nr:CYFA0S26e00716g1_1 [Cyberlindnera fabianii]
MSDTSLVFDAAWNQLDLRRRGYILAAELPLLIDALESYLSTPLLDSPQLNQIKSMARTSSQRVYKSDFKSMFSSIADIDLMRAIKKAGIDEKALETLKNEVLTSTPIKGDPMIQPSFKKEYKQYKRLSESQEREIEYRDEVIQKLEKKEAELAKLMNKFKEASKLAKDLEEDVLYRDRMVIAKDDEIKKKELELKRLREEVKRWKDEAKMWQTNNEDEWKLYMVKKERNFNNELLKRVQDQHKQIELLKEALARSNKHVSAKPIIVSSTPMIKSKTTIPILDLYPDLRKRSTWIVIGILVLLILAYSVISGPSNSPWYTGTWVEPWLFEWVENDSVDYDYYNLGAVNEDYLVSIR